MGLRLLAAVVALISTTFLSPTAQAANLESVLADQANLTTFRGLVKNHTDIFAKLPKDVTIAAPNDAAFMKLGNWGTYDENMVESILKYHILKMTIDMPSIVKGDSIWAPTLLADRNLSTVTGGQHLILTKQPGGEVVLTSGFATRGTVVTEDLAFDDGLVQVIDSVMRVPETLDATARGAYTDLTAFVGALYATGLYDEVAGWKDVTIFAPRNAAFQQLAGTFSRMDEADLRRVLRYHIIPGRVSHVWELRNASTLATADGSGDGTEVAVTRHTNFIYVNSAEIVQADVLIANGVVHLVDNVLNPRRPDARPDVELTTAQPPVFTPLGTATATGSDVPTPFATHLPCTGTIEENCQATSSQATGGPTGTSGGAASSNAGGALPRCTGLTGAGVGIGLAVGAVMAGL